MVLIELAQNTTSIVGKMPYGKLEKYYETNWKRKKEAEPLYNGSKIVPPPKCGLQKASTVFKRSSKCFCVHEKPEEDLIMEKMQNLEDAGTIMDFYRRMLFSQRAFSMLVL